jgi:cytochrome c-type biogenesis protein
MSPVALLALFGAGILSFLSPCVLPLVPVWVGVAAGEVDEPHLLVRATAWFVVGFTAVFVALGTVVGRAGALLDPGQTWTGRVGGALLVLFGLALVGVPLGRLGGEARLVRTLPRATSRGGGAAGRGLVAGVAFGAAWTPCVGPLLGAALLAAGGSGGSSSGAALLAAYSLGIGLPFLVASLAYTSWPAAQRRMRPLAGRLRVGSGVLLTVLGGALLLGASDRFFSPAARLLGPS